MYRRRSFARTSPKFRKLQPKTNSNESIDFGITGVKYVCDPNLNVWKRFGWFLALVTCSVVCVFQVTDIVCYYLTEPTTTNVLVKLNDAGDIPLPSFTLCPSILSTNSLLDLIIMHLAEKESAPSEPCPECEKGVTTLPPKVRMSQVLDMFDLNGHAIETSQTSEYVKNFLEDRTNLPFAVVPQVTELPRGKCVTLNPVQAVSDTPTKLLLSYSFHLEKFFSVLKRLSPCTKRCYAPSKFTFDFTFHDPEISQRHLVAFYDNVVRAGEKSTFRLSLKQFFARSTKQNPCSLEKEKMMSEFERCTEEVMIKNIPCRLPFIRLSTTLEPCDSPQALKLAVKAAIATYIVNKTEVASECSNRHRPPCHKSLFTTEHKFSSESKDNDTVELLVDMQNVFELIQEEYSYTWTALTSDISGSLGFLLGICLLHVVEILDYLFTKLDTTLRRRKNH